MNQLLIVNSAKALNAGLTAGDVNDLSGLQEGAITFFELGASTALATAPKKNFAIAIGRGANKPAFVIPEVDVSTLEIVKTSPAAGAKFSATFTMPAGATGDGAKDKEFTVILVKKGVVPHERNLFTTSIVVKPSTTAANAATAFVKAVNDKSNELFNVTASANSTAVTITANDDADYEIKFADDLTGTTTSSLTAFKPTIGDKAFIEKLAQKCAAGKGFNYLDNESLDINPGFPEAVEDIAAASVATGGYTIFNLHFATGRVAGKQVDERVWQYVYIAIPLKQDGGTGSASAALSSLTTILPEGNFAERALKEPVAAGGN